MKDKPSLFSAIVLALIAVVSCSDPGSTAIAKEVKGLNQLTWRNDPTTVAEIAVSRSAPAFNFFDVGNLSPQSLPVVKANLTKIAEAAGETLDRTLGPSIEIIHDTNVFSRLKNDKRSFNALGIPGGIVDQLASRILDGSPKCLTMSFTDAKGDIHWTIILLSEQSNNCLVSGLLEAFGVHASNLDTESLASICALYESRRRGLRNRENLSHNFSKLRAGCLTKIGGKDD